MGDRLHDGLAVNAYGPGLDAGGEPLAEEDYTLEWTRVGGSERCGGPMMADPVLLDI